MSKEKEIQKYLANITNKDLNFSPDSVFHIL